ncbi:MAG: tail fiber protein [Rhodocyclaceae bacterium]|nr:tail fiber protein [Rhodocyclaceae bacterium]
MKQRNKRHIRSSAAAVGMAALLGSIPLTAQACGEDAYMGTVCTVAFDWCPRNTMPAKGQLLNVSQNAALFSLLGSVYGGDGRTTFALPNLQGRVVVGAGTGTGLTPVPLGQASGKERTTLTAANLPPQIAATISGKATGPLELALSDTAITGQTIAGNVTVNALNGDSSPSGAVNTPTATANTVGRAGPTIFSPPGTTKVAVPTTHNLSVTGGTVTGKASGNAELSVAGTVAITGGGAAPVDTIPPRLGMTVCIVTAGIYPPRPD